jgi:G3E family GTPase
MTTLPSTTPVPVTILTGFLGAGKTTVLNHLLHSDHGLRVAVLVNDFGAVNIDSQLITSVEDDMVSLSNGCICCTIRGDLLKAVIDLIRRPEAPEYIIVETSGVSDPLEVAITFEVPQLSGRIQVDAIITVVDAEQVRQMKQREYEILSFAQIGVADVVLINKTDLITPQELNTLHYWIREITPSARILNAVQGVVAPEFLLGVGQYSPERVLARQRADVHVHEVGEAHDHEHDHAHTDHSLVFSTWHWESDQPLSLKALRKAIETLPVEVYRAKGFAYVADRPEKRAILHVVGRRVNVTWGDSWGAEAPYSQLVFIGTHEGLDTAALQAGFQGTLAANATGNDIQRLADTVLSFLRRSD